MTKILFAIISIPLVFIGLSFVPLPDLPQEVLDMISVAFKYAWIANKYVAIDTLFTFAGYALLIEITLFVLKIYDALRSSITGAKPLFTFARFRNDEDQQ